MSPQNQDSVAVLVEFGADLEALDTYGMTPLHRMVMLQLVSNLSLFLIILTTLHANYNLGKQ